jgi:DNA-binding NarL/FixJ family response regulator
VFGRKKKKIYSRAFVIVLMIHASRSEFNGDLKAKCLIYLVRNSGRDSLVSELRNALLEWR